MAFRNGAGITSRERAIGAIVIALGTILGAYAAIPFVTIAQWQQRNQQVDKELAHHAHDLERIEAIQLQVLANQQRVMERLKMK